MRKRPWSYTVIFGSLSLMFSVWAVQWQYRVEVNRQIRSEGCLGFKNTRLVFVSTRPLSANWPLTRADVVWRELPSQFLPSGRALAGDAVLGLKLARDVEAGAVLTWEDLGFVSG